MVLYSLVLIYNSITIVFIISSLLINFFIALIKFIFLDKINELQTLWIEFTIAHFLKTTNKVF